MQVMLNSLVPNGGNNASRSMFREENELKFPEFVLEKEFQCHNTQLVKEVVCKTIQKFVKNPQDVRLAITVSFQPHITGNDNSHEQEAVATIEVDKPGNFYPGGQEQRVRNKELEVLRQVEKTKQQERREMRRLAREEEERKRRKMETGLKRPSGGTVHERARMTRVAPPLPFKAETRRLPSGEMYAVREWVYSYTEKEPVLSLPFTSDAFGEPMIVRETQMHAYEQWHLIPDSEPDAHAVGLQGAAKEEREALKKGHTELKGEPKRAVPSTTGVTKATGEDMGEQKPSISLSRPPQKIKEIKKPKKEQKKRQTLKVRKISVVEPKVYEELVKSQPGDPTEHTVTSQPVIILSQKGQSKLHAQPISTQIPPTVPSSAPPPEVEVEPDILNTDQQTSAQSTISSPASTGTVEEGSLHEFKTPPDSSSAAISPVLPAKTVEDMGVVKPPSKVPVSALSAATQESGKKETPQKVERIQDVTPATTSAQKPVKVTQTEQASTTEHLVTPTPAQEVTERQKEKTELYLSTLSQSVAPSGTVSTSPEGLKVTKSALKQPAETPAALPLAAVAEKEEKQSKTLETALPYTDSGIVDQDQSKATKVPQLQATPGIPSASGSEEENDTHKVSDASKEAHHVVTTTTHQIAKEGKVTKSGSAPAFIPNIPSAPLPMRAEEEKTKQAEVPVSTAISVGLPPKIGVDNTVRKEPSPVSAIPSAALPESAEKEVTPKRGVFFTPLSSIEEKAKEDVKAPLMKMPNIPSEVSPPKASKKPKDLRIEKERQRPRTRLTEEVQEKREPHSTKVEPTLPVVPMPTVVKGLKLTKSDRERATSTLRYAIRSVGSQEGEEEEKPRILAKPPPQPDMPSKAVEHLETTEFEYKKKASIPPSPEGSLSGSAEEEPKKDIIKPLKKVQPIFSLPNKEDLSSTRNVHELWTKSRVISSVTPEEEKKSLTQPSEPLPIISPTVKAAEDSQITKSEAKPSDAKVHATPPFALFKESVNEETPKKIEPQTVAKALSGTPSIIPLKIAENFKAKELEQKQPISEAPLILSPATLPHSTDVNAVPKIAHSTALPVLPRSAEEEETEKFGVKPFPPVVSPIRVPLKVVEVLDHADYKPHSSIEKTKVKEFDSKQLTSEVSALTSPSVLRKSEQEKKEKNIEPRLVARSQSPNRPTILPFKIGADVKVTKVKLKQPVISSTIPVAASPENVSWTKPEGFSLDIRKTQPSDQPIVPSPKALEEVKIANLELQQPIHIEDSVVLALSSSKETEKTRSPLPIAEQVEKAKTETEEVLQKPPSEAKPVQPQIISMGAKKEESETKSTIAISPTFLPSPATERKMKFEPPPILSPKVIKDKKHYKRKVVHPQVEPQPLIPVVMKTELEEKVQKSEPRRPSVEEMNAVRELGSPRDDATDRDGFSLETIDVQSAVDLPQHETFYIAMPDDSRIETKGSANIQGSIKLKDDGKSPKVLAYINVG